MVLARTLILTLATLIAAAPNLAAQISTHAPSSISIDWTTAALVVGALQPAETNPEDAFASQRYTVRIEQVVTGDVPGATALPVRLLGGEEVYQRVEGKQCLIFLRGPRHPVSNSRSWWISDAPVDFMPRYESCVPIGPETDNVIREMPAILEIANAGLDRPEAERLALLREAVWSAWSAGTIRRELTLQWIIDLDLPGRRREATLDFLTTVVTDRTLPPACRFLADSVLANPQLSPPDYANNTPARTALLIELLAHPDLPEHTREQAERTLADLSRRLEAENTAAPQAE